MKRIELDGRDTAPLRQYLGIEVFPVVYSAAADDKDGPGLKFASTFNVVCYTAVFRVVTQRSSPLTLRDDTKNGYVADYF